MKQGIETKVETLSSLLDVERSRRKPRQMSAGLRPWVWSILASLGIFGGISALFVGLVFVVIHGMLSSDVMFNRFGTGLLIVAIPMILLGAICLDQVEGK
jgi:hypothetical protein